MMILVWIVVTGLTCYYFYREYGEVLKVKINPYPNDDQGRRIMVLRELLEDAKMSLSIVDYRPEKDSTLYENGDILELITSQLRVKPKLRFELATTSPRDNWLAKNLEHHPRVTINREKLGAGGKAIFIAADGGAAMYTVNSWGKAKRVDCRDVGWNARKLVIGNEINAIDELFTSRTADDQHEETPGPTRPADRVGVRQSPR